MSYKITLLEEYFFLHSWFVEICVIKPAVQNINGTKQ